MKKIQTYHPSLSQMIGIVISIILAVFLVTSCAPTKYVGGIQINEADQTEWAKTLKASGMNTAQVTAYAKQGAWNSDHLWWESEDTTYIINEIRALKAEKIKVILILRVALQHIYDPNMYKWHGMIYPTSRAQQNEWFFRYNDFVEMWSKICEREDVDVLGIASEMNAMTSTQEITELPELIEYFSNRVKQRHQELKIIPYERQLRNHDLWQYGRAVGSDITHYVLSGIESNIAWTKEAFHVDQPDAISFINEDRRYLDSNWRSIIAHTRKYFKGKITMAANFDSYDQVSFWDDLDFIGINAYFSLRPISRRPIDNDSIYTELVNGWEDVFTDISCFKTENHLEKKPIFFTEIGYTQKQNCTIAPWKGDGYHLSSTNEFDTLLVWNDVIDKPEERVMALKALKHVVSQNKIPLIGLNYWKLTSHAYHSGYEPFMLYINEEDTDELQTAIARFSSRKKI